MQTLRQDLRYGARTLRQQLSFTVVAVLTLALGIGVTTAIFSFVDAVLLKPLAYQDAERLVTVWDNWRNCQTCPPSPPTFLEWKTMNTVFTHVAGYTSNTQSLNLTGRDEAEQLQARQVTANYFEMLGVPTAWGRHFRADEEQVGNEQVVILSQRLWQRRFNADPNIVGATIMLDEKPHTVVGVLPPHQIFDRMDNDLWTPLTIPPDRMRRTTQYFIARAKLKPGVTLAQANAEMKRLSESIAQADPAMKEHVTKVEPLRQSIVATDLRGTLWLLLGAVGFILLIASVNVANLLLARGAARRKEVLIRLAVGASGWRLMRQLLTESLLLAALGGAFGLILSYWLMKAFVLLSPPGTIPREAVVGLDYRVLLFTLGVSMLTGIFFGLLPAWQATRANLNGLLQEHSLRGSSRHTSRNLLLVSEIALTFVLVIGAALMVKSFSRLLQVDPGFEAERVLTFRSTLAKTRFPTAAQTLAYQNEFLTRLRALPTVKAAGVTGGLPMSGVNFGTDFRILGRPNTRGVGTGNARFRAVDAGYFNTLGIRLVKGRLISERDTPNSPRVVVVNQNLANKFFPDSDPIGGQVTFAGPQPYTIVGVAADVKYNGLDADTPIEMYVPLAQLDEGWTFDSWGRRVTFVAYSSADPKDLIGAVRSIAVSLDKDQPLHDLKTMSEVVAASTATPRFRTFLFFIFGALALLLAAIGIYGVISYATAQITHEIGIRVALGAQRRDIFQLIIGQGMTLTALGLLIGLAGAFWLTRFLSNLLFHISATDAATYVMASGAMLVVAMLACYLPARRATKVDPMVALRHE
jgi:putative ABC transport system permease protein